MAIGGAKPKPPGQAVTRVPQKFEWLEVPDRPNPNPPPMPARRPRMNTNRKWVARAWPEACAEKWDIWSRMPHTVVWTKADWDWAADALHAAAMAMEITSDPKWDDRLRQYEKVMGTTRDALLTLRIRYTEPVAEAGADAGVARMADYRAL